MTENTHPTLLVLAAGMGSRYGGLKQLDPMGPSGQTMLDYAVEDAIRAGFAKIVFVIRQDFKQAFEDQIGSRYRERIQTGYAFQTLDALPHGHRVPDGRTKPWGTAQAVLVARDVVREPFAVINADDFYGRDAYQQIATHLVSQPSGDLALSLVGYPLKNTLSPHGSVNRGVCRIDERGNLTGVEEHIDICEDDDGVLRGNALDGQRKSLDPNVMVSMNFWGFSPAIFEHIAAHFENFLKAHGQELKSECYLPSVVDAMLSKGDIQCPVLRTDSPWFGVTYPDDKPRVVASIQHLTDTGLYQP